jgi:ATP-dependent Lon protease
MFAHRKLYAWKGKIRKMVNKIQENNSIVHSKQLISDYIFLNVNENLYNIYFQIDKMNSVQYFKLYKKVYFYSIYPILKESMCHCGTSCLDDILNLNFANIDPMYKEFIMYFQIYKVETITQNPELDEEFNLQFAQRKCFFWNSYPANTKTIIEQIHGAKFYIPQNSKHYIVLHGIFSDDAIIYMHDHKFVSEKIKSNDKFTQSYIKMLSLKDVMVNDTNLFNIILQNAKKEFLKISSRSFTDLQNEIQKINTLKQRKNILLLLCSESDEDHIKAKSLYDISQCVHMPLFANILLKNAKQNVQEKIRFFDQTQDINYKEKIVLLKTDTYVKQKAFEKLRDVQSGREISSKAQQYIDGILKIPFGVYIEEPVFQKFKQIQKDSNCILTHSKIKQNLDMDNMKSLNTFDLEKVEYMNNVRNTLDSCVHGHDVAKNHIERLIGQWIHGKMKGSVFGFQGPPGTGKTTLAKNGFAKCLLDLNGNSRPIAFLPIGGSSGSSFLEGHGYTYMGSTWGRIIDILMEQKCMNPIIYIDELDKISMSEKGQEIIGILIHLTDPSQNNEFNDKYFAGIKFDLSKAIIIFSYNDSSKVDKILRDRITEIHMSPLSRKDKLVITNKFIIPEILDDIGFASNDVNIEESVIDFLIDTYTNEAGVRKLKELLYTILREINIKYIKNDINLPFGVDLFFVKKLFIENSKNITTVIGKVPSIGKVNGLYASTQGTGGITIIEVHITPSDDRLSLTLTGSQGDVMKESMKCAKTLAWNLLTQIQKDKIGKYGLHIHCPMGATPKDGPSAGCAITLAIYSRLTDTLIKNDIAMTGEINLDGNIHAIGGLEAKLFGAYNAGAKVVLIPEENKDDYDLFLSKYTINLEVHTVTNINEVLKYALFCEKEE